MKKTKVPILILTSLWIIIFLLGCIKNASEYFPLNEGNTWKYRRTVTKNDNDISKDVEMVITSLKKTELKGKKVIPLKTDYTKNYYLVNFVTKDGQGVYSLATQSSEEIEPKMKLSPFFLIKYPVKINSSWDNEAEFLFEITKQKEMIHMKYIIESLKENIIVPAGSFSNCLKIKNSGHKTLTKGDSTEEFIIDETVWMAPGIGIVQGLAKTIHKIVENSFGAKKLSETTWVILNKLESFNKGKVKFF